jgi:hypothetical protein
LRLLVRHVSDHAHDVNGTIGFGRVGSTPGHRFADVSIAPPRRYARLPTA